MERATHRGGGAIGGGRFVLMVYPDDDLAVVIATNLMGAMPDAFVDDVAGFFVPDMSPTHSN